MLSAAQEHFRKMIELNPDLEEAKFAKANLRSIDTALASLPRPRAVNGLDRDRPLFDHSTHENRDLLF